MSIEKVEFESLKEGTRFIYRRNHSSLISEDKLEERSPSGMYLKFYGAGWLEIKYLSFHCTLIEILNDVPSDDMCPNCVTPWKCNGSHTLNPCRGAPGGSPQLDEYMRRLGV